MKVNALYSGELSVDGIGRVGSYAAAVRAKRCRPHKYWAIMEWEWRPAPEPNMLHERRDLGKFKTKKLANEFLLSVSDEAGCWRNHSDTNSYIQIKLHEK